MGVEFGIFPVPNAADAGELQEHVLAAEQAGLDLVGSLEDGDGDSLWSLGQAPIPYATFRRHLDELRSSEGKEAIPA